MRFRTAVAIVAAAAALAAGQAAMPSLAPAQALAQAQARTGQGAAGMAAVLAVEDARAPHPDDLRVLVSAATSGDVAVQRAAVRALGRLERRELIADLLPSLRAADAGVRNEAATALSLALRGPALEGVSAEEQTQAVFGAIIASPHRSAGDAALGHLPVTSAGQFRQVERVLFDAIRTTPPELGAVRALEDLSRLNRKLLPLEDQTAERLRAIATSRDRTYAPDLRRNAMAALTAALASDTATLATAVKDSDPEVRRLAMLSLAGAGVAIDNTRRVELLRDALSDRTPMVRLEALKGWVRRGIEDEGCARVIEAVGDADANVALFALDTLGAQCKEDVVATDRLTVEARTPRPAGPWQREAHAFVALATRSRERASLAMPAFGSHPRWQVRMYAARAASVMDDGDTLSRLALDADDNVREAALPALRRLLGADSDPAFVAALQRPDYQLLRTAARELKGSTPTQELAGALGAALERVTAEKKETSRDPRMAIIERLGELGTARDASSLRPLARDFDPAVAAAAAALLRRWHSDTLVPDPQLLPRQPLPSRGELGENVHAVVTMDNGRSFTLAFATEQAPLSRTRFIRLARANYYDGLTFHRVVANAFIQGGSPGANEYAGDRLYMRDEVGLEMHTRGSVGVSTRGRDTGDAQIFINLVDNPFLDHQYTVFARVCDGMEVVDGIQEGDRMVTVEVRQSSECR